MGILDKIKRDTGLNYLEAEKPKKTTSTKSDNKPSTKQDSELRFMETEIQKIIEKLQVIQEKLRVRRGI